MAVETFFISQNSAGKRDIDTERKISGLEAVNQILVGAVVLWRGNWFADLTNGVNWLSIFRKKFSIAGVRDEIKRVLLAVGFVSSVVVVTIDVNKTTRLADIGWTVIVSGEKITGGVSI